MSAPGVARSTPPNRRRMLDALVARSSRSLVLGLGLTLFVLAATPLFFTEVPPMQDLPNHLASIHVVTHPALYPEFVFNGHMKTNGALFAWLHAVGGVTGTFLAAKLFTFLVLAAGAFALPWAVLVLTESKAKAVLGCLFAWPMVHNWFVSMGMLDFALGVPISLAVLALCHVHLGSSRSPRAPRGLTGALIALLGVIGWYAHVFALLVMYLLILVELARRGRAGFVAGLRALALPLCPAATLVVLSVAVHLGEPKGTMSGHVAIFAVLPAWELLYNAWAEWLWGFTKLEALTLLPTAALVIFALRGRKVDVPFFSSWALGVLVAAYIFTPYAATNWFHMNSRFLPYLWFAALVRVPERLPRGVVGLGLVAAVLNTVAMSVDYTRLERDRRAFTAGIDAVPRGARLMPLVFRAKGVSENSRSLLHAWGFYVVAKDTSAPLLFAHSRSFPVMYREAPPDRWNHLVLEGFAPGMRSADGMCAFLHQNNLRPDDCPREYRERWAEFWAEATPRFDHVLMWEATPEARANVPPSYRVSFERAPLVIYERVSGGAP
ncbi:MAG: hypothetical protein IPF92_07435 [Myxococcales bacterium]|nr:hypothetical protein [Myxococcales bacterium]